MTAAIVHRVIVRPLEIPLRSSVEHATSRRAVSDTIIIELELTNGVVGFGETLPRPYVSGESVDSVLEAVRDVYAPALLGFHPESFPQALEFVDALPWVGAKGRPSPAARGGVEMALLAASLRYFDRTVDDIVAWMGLGGFGRPGSSNTIRFSGVLASDDMGAMMRRLRLMYWAGLRHFKLKVGSRGDVERLRRAARYLRRAIGAGRASLRVDANGAWSLEEAEAWLSKVQDVPIAAVEQPLPRGSESLLAELRRRFDRPYVHDESLIDEADARRLIDLGGANVFNIRLSKCGGFMPSLRLAALARRSGVRIQFGCMVGETSILSALGLRFLEVCPGVQWAEGCLGTWLLRDDITTTSLRFGLGGRPPKLAAREPAVLVDTNRLLRLAGRQPQTHQL